MSVETNEWIDKWIMNKHANTRYLSTWRMYIDMEVADVEAAEVLIKTEKIIHPADIHIGKGNGAKN